MKVIETALPGVLILEPIVHEDDRGFFMEVYVEKQFHERGIGCHFVQDNHSFSRQKGTLRGLHFQNNPLAQAKLVRVVQGVVLDVVVDLRQGSPNFGKWIKEELSAVNKRMLFVPRGFAHGFLTLSDEVAFLYKVDNYYSKEHSRSLAYNDPVLAIDWGIKNPILSEQDRQAPALEKLDCNFFFSGEGTR